MAQLAEWSAVVTCAPMIEEARAMLLDAAHEMIATYRDEGREPPIGGGHAEALTINPETPDPAVARVLRKADEGIRTLDLRHGNVEARRRSPQTGTTQAAQRAANTGV